ncbi:MAG: ABC transporter substrate-binding protein [Fuerstiella sp.]|jgi:putative ABC transport system substrate-binding protein|nr:ABC transporter substrate-binding protein [Fuerstiella sp.]MDG2130312.1 ABC transporter substrate-binding protein [Fuerstiella sp.]
MSGLLTVFRRLAIGMVLICVSIGILLWSDPKRSGSSRPSNAARKIAVVSFATVPVLEEGVNGLLAGLAQAGFRDGEGYEIKVFNAEGELATASLIAREIVGDDYELVTTISTPTLQAVAVANTHTKLPHVFTLTTDPWGAGIGVSRDDPLDHPSYMTGYGSLQPVESLFNMALMVNPHLKTVGVVWNPAESNSESSTLAARAACKKLKIELIEATVDTSSGVVDAVNSLISREVEAIWSGGDSTVSSAREAMVAAATKASIPIFTNMPQDVEQGALFCVGADYYEVAYAGGLLAARVLNGESTADIPIENMVPEQMAINLKMLPNFFPVWKFKREWEQTANVVIQPDGTVRRNETTKTELSTAATSHQP